MIRPSWISVSFLRSFLGWFVGVLSAAALIGCAPRPRMCRETAECATQSACVAGRCQPDRPTVKPAVDSARRWVFAPSDLAYVDKHEPRASGSDGALPPLFALGKDGGVLFLRFSVALPATANLVEAYVVLRRAGVVDDDPSPISLHASRIIDPWEGRSTSWEHQPRLREARTPATVVEPGGPRLVRIDVRDLVRHWSKHDRSDQGIAIVAESESPTGTTFAITSLGAEREGTDDVGGSAGAARGPGGYESAGRPDALGSAGGARVGPSGSAGAPSGTSLSAPDVGPYLELYVR